MIENLSQYLSTQDQIRLLEERLERLNGANPIGSKGSKGLTKAGIHKMIAKLHLKMADYVGGAEELEAGRKVPQSIEEIE